MKCLYLIFPAVLFSSIIFGQSVISNVVPNFGDQFVLNQAEVAPSPGPSGANKTWDFSNQIIDDFTGSYSVMHPDEVEGSDLFPNATMVWLADLEGMVLASYFGFENNKFTEYGSKTDYSGFTSGVNYSDPIDHFTYPLSYQNSGTDTYSGEVIGVGGDHPITGTQSYEVDGWGTLITPYETFEDVLRITHTAEETLGGNITVLTNRTQTSWYSPDYPIPVMVIVTDFSTTMGMPLDTTQTISALVSYTSGTVGIRDHKPENTFTIYPNPTTDYITLKTDGQNENIVLKIYSANGKLVKEASLNRDENIDVSVLSPGIYIAVMLVDGKRYAEKPFSVVR